MVFLKKGVVLQVKLAREVGALATEGGVLCEALSQLGQDEPASG